MPIKLMVRLILAVFGAMGIRSTAVESASSALGWKPVETPMYAPDSAPINDAAQSDQHGDRMIDKIGDMADGKQETNVGDISPEERQWQDEQPRNPKKRMFEAKDEL